MVGPSKRRGVINDDAMRYPLAPDERVGRVHDYVGSDVSGSEIEGGSDESGRDVMYRHACHD